jgi:lysophospholipase L1-like esterase
MFGAASLPLELEDFLEFYADFIDAVRIQYPGARVFVQSVPPVTRDAPLSNDRIDEYNLALMQLAREKRAHFLDVNSALLDESGRLPENFAPSDGIHLGAEAYYIWFEYLRWHTI